MMEDTLVLLLKFLVQSLCLQLELAAFLYPFCFPCLISYKREKHLLTTEIIYFIVRARMYLWMCCHSSEISTFSS